MIDGSVGLSRAVQSTRMALTWRGDLTLFEATFRHKDVLVRADVLERRDDAYRLVEVKSATAVREHHLRDLAVQAWVAEGAGVTIARLTLATVDPAFTYRGGEEYSGLLCETDVTGDVRRLTQDVPGWIRGLREVLNGPLPMIAPSGRCRSPYECPYISYCEALAGRVPTQLQAGMSRRQLDLQEIARVSVERPNAALNGASSRHAFLALGWFNYAVPRWAGTRPYQRVLGQWSCRIYEGSGEIRRCDFIDLTDDAPPRRAALSLLRALVDVDVVIVDGSDDAQCLRNMASLLPDHVTEVDRLLQGVIVARPDVVAEASVHILAAARDEVRRAGTTGERVLELHSELAAACALRSLALARLAHDGSGA